MGRGQDRWNESYWQVHVYHVSDVGDHAERKLVIEEGAQRKGEEWDDRRQQLRMPGTSTLVLV